MSEQHTQGRLYLLQNYKTVAHAEQGTRGRRVFDAYSMGDQPENEANARRLAACWNYCEGLDTEGMELAVKIGRPVNVTINEGIKKELDLLAQRDELLQLLEGILKCERGMLGHLFLEGWQEQVVRDAISKVKGGAA